MNELAQKKLRKHLLWLSLATLLMFGFAFALVPLYNVMCKVTGLNGKTQTNDIMLPNIEVDTSRYITVELIGTTNEKIPAKFYPQATRFKIHPGEFIETAFFVQNLSQQPMVIQAIPSVAPGPAGSHVKKEVCFCFQHQDLPEQELLEMPLRFTVDPKVPKEISTVTLAYTLFDVT